MKPKINRKTEKNPGNTIMCKIRMLPGVLEDPKGIRH